MADLAIVWLLHANEVHASHSGTRGWTDASLTVVGWSDLLIRLEE